MAHEELITDLVSMGTALEQKREPWITLMRTCFEFANPSRDFDPTTEPIADKTPKMLYNTRGVIAAGTAAGGFQGYSANGMSQWFKLGFADPLLSQQPGVADYLEDCERILYAVFNRQGLYNALGEVTPDGIVGGTGYLHVEEDPARKRVIFTGRHPRAVMISENATGEVDHVVEDLYMTYRAAEQRFGDKLGADERDMAKRNPFASLVLRHFIIPRDERFRVFASRDFDPDMGYTSIWYNKKTQTVLDVGGYWELPTMAWRYAKNSGEEYGRSCAANALGELKGANQIHKSTLRLAQLISDPPFIADETLEGRDYILPGGRIYTGNADSRFEPVMLGANYPISTDREERIDAVINDHFNVPLYLMLQSAQREMTAREVIERMGEKAAVLGYITGRHQTEVLQPLIRRTFNILFRNGMLPRPPQIVLDAKAPGGLDVTFNGFLAQVQRRYFQTNGITASLGFIQAMLQMFGPETGDNVDSDQLMREGLEASGSPQRVIREVPDVENRRALRAKAIAEQQRLQVQLAQEDTILKSASGLGKRPEEGSPLANLQAAGGAR